MKINGVPEGAGDGEIKKVLIAAGWSEKDCQEGIALLRSEVSPTDTKKEKKKKPPKKKEVDISRTSSKRISEQLGVPVVLDPYSINSIERGRGGSKIAGIFKVFFVTLLSIIVAVGILFLLMYVFGVGIFYVPVSYL